MQTTPRSPKDKITSAVKIIIIALLTLAQANALYYFAGVSDTKNWIIFAVTLLPLAMMNGYFVGEFVKRDNKAKAIIGTAILSVMFYIGIFLPYLNSFGMAYIKAVIGYIALFFVAIYLLTGFIEKIEWERKDKKPSIIRFIIYFIIPAAAYTVFMLACWPGLISPDSIYILNQATQGGPYDNLSPLLYTLSLRMFSVIGLKMGGMMVLQCLMCALAYAYVIYTFDRMGLPFWAGIIGSLLLAFYPMNLMTNITMWKDIPYTIGLTLIMCELIKITVQDDYFKRWQNYIVLIFALAITLIARHNGIATVVVTFFVGAVIYLFKKNWRRVLSFGIVIITSLVFYYGALNGAIAILGDKYQQPEDNKVTEIAIYALRVQGLVAVYHDKWDALSEEDKDYIDKYLDLPAVDEHILKYEEDWRFRSYVKNYADADALTESSREFNRGYIRLLREYPFDVINAYLKTTGIVWAAPSYGYTMHAAYTYNYYDEEIYSDLDLLKESYLHEFKDYILLEIYKKDAQYGGRAVLWRPALFMLLMLLFLLYALKKKGTLPWLVAAPAIVNSLGYLIINEAQDARYVYINFAAAVIMMAYATMKDKKLS